MLSSYVFFWQLQCYQRRIIPNGRNSPQDWRFTAFLQVLIVASFPFGERTYQAVKYNAIGHLMVFLRIFSGVREALLTVFVSILFFFCSGSDSTNFRYVESLHADTVKITNRSSSYTGMPLYSPMKGRNDPLFHPSYLIL